MFLVLIFGHVSALPGDDRNATRPQLVKPLLSEVWVARGRHGWGAISRRHLKVRPCEIASRQLHLFIHWVDDVGHVSHGWATTSQCVCHVATHLLGNRVAIHSHCHVDWRQAICERLCQWWDQTTPVHGPWEDEILQHFQDDEAQIRRRRLEHHDPCDPDFNVVCWKL